MLVLYFQEVQKCAKRKRAGLERTFAAGVRELGSEQELLDNNFHNQKPRLEQQNARASCSDLPMPAQLTQPCLRVQGYLREFAHVAAVAILLPLVPEQNKIQV